MRVNLILVAFLIHILGTCFGYKLRRDVGKLRHYCNVICSGCGGEATVDLDFCTCKIEEEDAEVEKCLERANNKFNYLGIKWRRDHGLVNKRSIYGSNELAFTDEFGFADDVVRRQKKKSVVRRSDILQEGVPVIDHSRSRRRRIMLQQEPPLEEIVETPLDGNDVASYRARRSLNDLQRDFDMDYITPKMFQPIMVYRNKQPGHFKFLVGAPRNLDRPTKVYYVSKGINKEGIKGRYDDFASSEENFDYSDAEGSDDGIDTGRFNIGRFGNRRPQILKLVQLPKERVQIDDNASDLRSALENVLPAFFSENYYCPGEYLVV